MLNCWLILSRSVTVTVSLIFDSVIACSVFKYCRVVDASQGSSGKLVMLSIRRANLLPGSIKA